MKSNIDISVFTNKPTIQSTTNNLVDRFKLRRKELKLTQKKLSTRSGVSYGSIRRFESSGDISLSSLLKIANAMDTLNEFNEIFNTPLYTNLKDVKNEKH